MLSYLSKQLPRRARDHAEGTGMKAAKSLKPGGEPRMSLWQNGRHSGYVKHVWMAKYDNALTFLSAQTREELPNLVLDALSTHKTCRLQVQVGLQWLILHPVQNLLWISCK